MTSTGFHPLRDTCHRLGLGVVLSTACVPSAAGAAASFAQPIRFFEGRTEMVSVVKVAMRKPYRSQTVGRGRILPDGSLALVQDVRDSDKPARQRVWRIRQAASGQFVGTMSEALGPVSIVEVNGRYRFNFKMKGNLMVEQWITPLPSGNAARSETTIKKFGVRVARSEGFIRKLESK